MAAFRKVGKSWRVEIYVNGQRKSATRDTKAQAKEWAAQEELKLKSKKSDLPEHTLREALERYCKEETPKSAVSILKICELMRLLEMPHLLIGQCKM